MNAKETDCVGELASSARRSPTVCFHGGIKWLFYTAMPSYENLSNNKSRTARSSTPSSTTKAKEKKAMFGRALNNKSPSPENVTIRKCAKFIPTSPPWVSIHSLQWTKDKPTRHLFGLHRKIWYNVCPSAQILNFMKMLSAVRNIQKIWVGMARDCGVLYITQTFSYW